MNTEEKPKTAIGYVTAQTEACERVLVTLLSAFGTLKDTIRLVGGLVPRYLTPEMSPDIPAHAGTTDVDIVFNLQVIAEGDGYDSLAKQLKARGFSRYQAPNKPPSSWQWERKISEHESVVVEFLHHAFDKDQEGHLTQIEGEQVSALGIRHAAVVHDWYEGRHVTAELFDGGGISTEVVRYADVTSFIVLKAIAFEQRGENKDAGDLVHVMRYAGTPAEVSNHIIQRYRSGLHNQAILDALTALEVKFCEGHSVEGYRRDGPVAAARFKLGLNQDDDDERIREQRYVTGLVSEIVGIVRQEIATK